MAAQQPYGFAQALLEDAEASAQVQPQDDAQDRLAEPAPDVDHQATELSQPNDQVQAAHDRASDSSENVSIRGPARDGAVDGINASQMLDDVAAAAHVDTPIHVAALAAEEARMQQARLVATALAAGTAPESAPAVAAASVQGLTAGPSSAVAVASSDALVEQVSCNAVYDRPHCPVYVQSSHM